MTDEELIEELSEMGGHPCRARLPMGERLRQAASRIEALTADVEELRDAWQEYLEAAETLVELERRQDTTKRFDRALDKKYAAIEKARAALEKQP